jgi:hypothetical protein
VSTPPLPRSRTSSPDKRTSLGPRAGRGKNIILTAWGRGLRPAYTSSWRGIGRAGCIETTNEAGFRACQHATANVESKTRGGVQGGCCLSSPTATSYGAFEVTSALLMHTHAGPPRRDWVMCGLGRQPTTRNQ